MMICQLGSQQPASGGTLYPSFLYGTVIELHAFESDGSEVSFLVVLFAFGHGAHLSGEAAGAAEQLA